MLKTIKPLRLKQLKPKLIYPLHKRVKVIKSSPMKSNIYKQFQEWISKVFINALPKKGAKYEKFNWSCWWYSKTINRN